MSAWRQTDQLILEPTHVRWSRVQRSVSTTKCSVNVQDACNKARWLRETLPIADVSILLVVVRANFLTATNLLKMKMMPATDWHSCSYFATKDPIAIFRRMGVVALLLFSGCKDSPDLVDDGELQMRDMLVKSSRFVIRRAYGPTLSFSTRLFSHLDRSVHVAT